MNMTQVLYALKVADCRNFSRAAEQLFLSQSALSQQIRRLERELNYELFRRTPQGLCLTEDGERFCREARPLADGWYRFQQSVAGDPGRAKRRLRIGMGSRVFSNGLFPDIVRFFEQQKETDVTFFTEAGQDFLTGLREGTLDLALDRLPPERLAGNLEDLSVCELISEMQCVLTSREDPRSRLTSLSFTDLQGCTMMSGLENSIEDRTMRETCQEHGVTLSRIYRSDGIDAIMSLVRGGNGVTLGPRSFADYYGVAAVPLAPETRAWLSFICLKRNDRRKELVLLREYLRALCRGRGGASGALSSARADPPDLARKMTNNWQ